MDVFRFQFGLVLNLLWFLEDFWELGFRFWELGVGWMFKLTWGYCCTRCKEYVDVFGFHFGFDSDFI